MDTIRAYLYATLLCVFGILIILVSVAICAMWIQAEYLMVLSGLVVLALLMISADIIYSHLKGF